MSLLSAFNRQCHHIPDQLALVEANRQLSYLQLQLHVNHTRILLETEFNGCQRVAIALDRGIDAAIAILAVLQAGSCYVPLDLKNPGRRLNYIVNDADVQCIIGKGDCPDWLDQVDLWLDMSLAKAESEPTPSSPDLNADSLAAILYTSGSTGMPKGVALSHRAMKNFTDWAANSFTINRHDRIASLAPFFFDLSIFDLFTSLNQGATVDFIPASLTMTPSRLTSWLHDHQISRWYTVPSLLSFIALKGSLSSTPLPHLKTILFAGEVFPTATLMQLCKLLPEVDFYNLYGPTETNVCCYWQVERHQLQANQPIPIGTAACGSVLKIDPGNDELLVQSANNLSGYWQQGKLIPAVSADNFFSTGDKVSINKNGVYLFHGRLDRMLKCSGYRVEPAEIEHIILQCAEVECCAVIGIKDSTCGQRPAAAVVLKPGTVLTDIITPLKQKLPPYMQPSKFIVLDELPYLANGKTDYLALHTLLEKT